MKISRKQYAQTERRQFAFGENKEEEGGGVGVVVLNKVFGEGPTERGQLE